MDFPGTERTWPGPSSPRSTGLFFFFAQQSDFPLTQVEQLTSRPDNLGLSGPRKEREVRLEQVDDGESGGGEEEGHGEDDDNGSGGEEGQAEQESDLLTMWLPSHSFGENTEKKVESLVEKIGNFNHLKEKIINFNDFEELTIKLFFLLQRIPTALNIFMLLILLPLLSMPFDGQTVPQFYLDC